MGFPALLVKRPVGRMESVKGAVSRGVEHAGAKQVEVGPAVHLPRDHLEAVDLPLNRSVVPRQEGGRTDRPHVRVNALSEASEQAVTRRAWPGPIAFPSCSDPMRRNSCARVRTRERSGDRRVSCSTTPRCSAVNRSLGPAVIRVGVGARPGRRAFCRLERRGPAPRGRARSRCGSHPRIAVRGSCRRARGDFP